MRKEIALTIAALSFALLALAGTPVQADEGALYRVTITNLSYQQNISPPILATHMAGTAIFTAGEPASDELAAVAEDAQNAGLVSLLWADSAVLDVVEGGGLVAPGASETFEIMAKGRYNRLSAVGMLVSSNDAFFGLDGYKLPKPSSPAVVYAPAYDAGSEFNSEDCAFIPGPPCGNGGVRDTGGAEGFVHVHRGIHGTGSLNEADMDWRNPVVRIEIERVSD
jgi:hypothetical protein